MSEQWLPSGSDHQVILDQENDFMNTRKLTGDMSDQVERDREELVEMREVLAWASQNIQSSINYRSLRTWIVSDLFQRRFEAPTLYAALHSAWSNRKDKP